MTASLPTQTRHADNPLTSAADEILAVPIKLTMTPVKQTNASKPAKQQKDCGSNKVSMVRFQKLAANQNGYAIKQSSQARLITTAAPATAAGSQKKKKSADHQLRGIALGGQHGQNANRFAIKILKLII